MTGPRARDPQPGEPEYREHLALRIAQEIGAIRRDRSPLHLARAVVAMPEVRALLDQAAGHAALRDAGNALAVAAMKPHEAYWEAGLPDVDALDDAARAAAAWRSAAGALTEETDPRDLGFGADGHSDEQAGGEQA